jgi:hypothetical protein
MKNGQSRETGNKTQDENKQSKKHNIGHHHAQDVDRKKSIICVEQALHKT